ncbi:hypothetical protein NPIL_501891 [Nephila pilipes]|uniref:Uncharacterized protein n=1 Tax=Nephila pilipes TaxID=299642 RepID=A0A8X6NL46_NEPPI|nr:hypothetical protein NPIL_501891 [Nephila pilipes]
MHNSQKIVEHKIPNKHSMPELWIKVSVKTYEKKEQVQRASKLFRTDISGQNRFRPIHRRFAHSATGLINNLSNSKYFCSPGIVGATPAQVNFNAQLDENVFSAPSSGVYKGE